MAKTAEEQMITDAIKGTEQEIFADATGNDMPDTEAGEQGDRHLESMGSGLEGRDDDDEIVDQDGSEEEGDGAEDGDGDGKPARDAKTGQFKAKEGDEDEESSAEDGADPKGEKDAKAKPADKSDKGIPPGRLREEADRRRASEAERDTLRAERDAAREEAAAVKSEVSALSKRLDDLLTAVASGKLQQPNQPAQPAAAQEDDDPAPDIFADPEGYTEWSRRQVEKAVARVEQQREVDRVELSMQAAHERSGATFEEAYAAVTKLDPRVPGNRQLVQRIWSAPNPGKALIAWHNQNKTLAEVGDDPAAYREKIAKETREALMKDPEFRKQLLADLRAEAEGESGNGGGNKPRHVTRTPSLNGARGGAMGHVPDRRAVGNSDAEVFDFATSNN